MRLSFTHINSTLPLFCESIGYSWRQEPVTRLKGHRCYHWLQTETGTGVMTVGTDRFVLEPGQGILIRPNIPHTYAPANRHQTWQTNFLVFAGTLVDQLAVFLKMGETDYLPQMNRELRTFIRDHYSTFKADDINATLAQSVSLYQFVMCLKMNAVTKTDTTQTRQAAERILTLLTSRYREKITTKDLLQVSGYSPSYQNKVFQHYYGMSPMTYLIEYRLRQAKTLLMQHPEQQVQAVAEATGFSDVSHFIQQFKRSTGMTPFIYKKQFLS